MPSPEALAALAECDAECTSGCHSDECEHHGYIDRAEAARSSTPLDDGRLREARELLVGFILNEVVTTDEKRARLHSAAATLYEAAVVPAPLDDGGLDAVTRQDVYDGLPKDAGDDLYEIADGIFEHLRALAETLRNRG